MEYFKELKDLTKNPQWNPEEVKPIFSKHAIQMKYDPFENVPVGHRRCGNCGEIYELKEFKKKSKPGYDWKCSDCRDYTEAYK